MPTSAFSSQNFAVIPRWNDQPIELYHGTTLVRAHSILTNGVNLAACNPNADFGSGFYTTTLARQAELWADRKSKVESISGPKSSPAVLTLAVQRQDLGRLLTLAFVRGLPDADDFWRFVNHCRDENAHLAATGEYYDVVYGPVCRNRRLRTLYEGYDQISFHTNDARDLLNDPNRCVLGIL